MIDAVDLGLGVVSVRGVRNLKAAPETLDTHRTSLLLFIIN